jgi:hypothetical protein
MRFPSSEVSRRKKNPSTISRNRTLASWAERRAGLELRARVGQLFGVSL